MSTHVYGRKSFSRVSPLGNCQQCSLAIAAIFWCFPLCSFLYQTDIVFSGGSKICKRDWSATGARIEAPTGSSLPGKIRI